MTQNTSGLTRLGHQGLLMKHVRDFLPNFQVLKNITVINFVFLRSKILRLLFNCLEKICNILVAANLGSLLSVKNILSCNL